MFHPPAVQNTSVFREMFFAESPIGPIALLHLKAENADKTILYSHGNAEDVSNLTWAFSYFLKEKLSVCAYDYPGYGISPGIPTEKNVYIGGISGYSEELSIVENSTNNGTIEGQAPKGTPYQNDSVGYVE